MKITEIGKYRLTKDIVFRTNSISSAKMYRGSVITITQIDEQYHKVIGPELGDWHYWELPVEKIAEAAP